MEALWTYRDLAGLIKMKPEDDPRVALAAQLTNALRSRMHCWSGRRKW